MLWALLCKTLFTIIFFRGLKVTIFLSMVSIVYGLCLDCVSIPQHLNFQVACCCSLSFGLVTKVRACKSVGQEWAQESHFMLPKVWENVREWTFTLPSEFPLWELNSQWTFKFLKSNCRGQNSLDWKVHYIIGKLLERRCLKWACMTY